MNQEDIEKLNIGERIWFANQIFEIKEIKEFPHGKMIGVNDYENHIDYLNPINVEKVYNCNCCQGGGCPVCSGLGFLIS